MKESETERWAVREKEGRNFHGWGSGSLILKGYLNHANDSKELYTIRGYKIGRRQFKASNLAVEWRGHTDQSVVVCMREREVRVLELLYFLAWLEKHGTKRKKADDSVRPKEVCVQKELRGHPLKQGRNPRSRKGWDRLELLAGERSRGLHFIRLTLHSPPPLQFLPLPSTTIMVKFWLHWNCLVASRSFHSASFMPTSSYSNCLSYSVIALNAYHLRSLSLCYLLPHRSNQPHCFTQTFDWISTYFKLSFSHVMIISFQRLSSA